MTFSLLDWKRKEILFVVVVLAAVAGVSAIQLWVGGMKMRDAQRKADTELVGRAVERYFEDYGVYPPGEAGRIVSCGRKGEEACEWGEGEVVDVDNVVYLKRLPRDPLADRGWRYVYESDGKSFRIYAPLEYWRDKDARKGLTSECGDGLQCKWYVEK